MKRYMVKFPDTPLFMAAAEVVEILNEAGHGAWLIGGVVRDVLLGKNPKDADIVTTARPEAACGLFGGNPKQIGAAFGVTLVRHRGYSFEVATCREERFYLDGRRPESVKYTDSVEIDVARRDFTVNGLIYDTARQEVIDYVGGTADLDRGVIRTIGTPECRFAEDHLRMLRAVRFAARLRLSIEPETMSAIQRLCRQAARLAPERVLDELDMMLTGGFPADAARLLDETGLLAVLLPEIAAMKGVTQPEKFHPEGDVYEHTLLMLEHLSGASAELAWAVLLHDVGKPETLTVDTDGIEHFYRHDRHGGKVARAIAARLRMPGARADTIVNAVKNHMRFASVDRMRQAKLRLLMADPDFPTELELHRIDCIACHGKLDNFIFLLDRIIAQHGEVRLPEPLLTGRDLIELGMTPGPRFGKILSRIRELQLSGKLDSKAEAVAALRKTRRSDSASTR